MFRAILHGCMLLVAFSNSAVADVEVGKAPPDYLGKNAEGQPVLVSEHQGKLVIISFFASWCAPCRKELPVLEAIQRNAKDSVLVVAVNYKESRKAYRDVTRQMKDYTLTTTHDSTGSIGVKYGVKGIPRLIIVGRDGKVAAQHVGYREGDVPALLDELTRLWKETEPSASAAN